MSEKKHADTGEELTDDGTPEVSPFGAATPAEPFEVREEDGKLIYSAKGVDLIERKQGYGWYTVLVDVPFYEYRKGDVKHLCEPFDEQCDCTARELAAKL